MVVDDLFCIVHAAVTDLDGVAIEDFSKVVVSRARNLCSILVLTFLLNGGFYQSMLFRCLFFRLVGAFGW